MPADNHGALVKQIAAGDHAAFTELYRTYLPLVLRWSLRMTGDRELSADLTAEVFATVLLAAKRYRPDAGPVAAWLIGIAHNKLRESRRRNRVEDSARRRLGIEPVALTDHDLERVEELSALDDRLQELVDRLPAEQRAALLARVVDERPYPDIAADLHCSESVVRQRVSRGIRALRSGMESE
jgi:RNA polymerase sigma-70 factor (ECF subfamily)